MKKRHTIYNKENSNKIKLNQRVYDREKAKLKKTKDLKVCNACGRKMEAKCLLRHIGQSVDCRTKYGEEFHKMKAHSRKKTYTTYNKTQLEKKAKMIKDMMDKNEGVHVEKNMVTKIKFDHKFIFICDEIKLKDINPSGCIIKFDYPLFSYLPCILELDFISKEPKENVRERLQGTGEIFHQRREKKDVMSTLENDALEIKLYKENLIIGVGKANLDKFYPVGQDDEFEADKKYQIPLFKPEDLAEQEIIGSVDCILILEAEKSVICKSCKKYFKKSSILKHLAQEKDCKKEYVFNEIKYFKDETAERKNKTQNAKYDPLKRTERHKLNYDPLKRAQKHRLDYDSSKRAEKYREEKEKEKIEREKKSKEIMTRSQIEWKLKSHKTAKDRNKIGLEQAKEHFSKGMTQFKNIPLSEVAKAKIKDVKDNIEREFQSYEKEIDQAVSDAKNMSWDAADKLYGNLICTRSNGQAKLYTGWHKMHTSIDLAFKKVAMQLKIPYEWVCGCLCPECKLAKSIYEKKTN